MWWMKRVLGFLVLVAIAVAVKLSVRSDADAEVKKLMHGAVTNLDSYSAEGQYLDDLVDREHTAAFDASFSMGGRHSRSKIDMAKYFTNILEAMQRDCRKDGKPKVAEELAALEKVLVDVAKTKDS